MLRGARSVLLSLCTSMYIWRSHDEPFVEYVVGDRRQNAETGAETTVTAATSGQWTFGGDVAANGGAGGQAHERVVFVFIIYPALLCIIRYYDVCVVGMYTFGGKNIQEHQL